MTSENTQFQTAADRQHASQLSRQPSQPPTTIPGYETQRFLGAGAYGEVWVAIDQNTGRQVAIKFFFNRSGLDSTLLSGEVEKLVFLSTDRYVVQLLEVGWDSDPPYYVMEYIANGSLEDLLRAHGTLPVASAVTMFREIAIGLSHAHGKGVLHCDLKPANVLLDQDQMPRLADFGQSRLTNEQKPALGTLFFMAPEQADMDAVPDARWDVYALGAVMYRMLTGHAPYRTSVAISEIDSAASLPDRLAKYRRFIREQPLVTGHRRIRGVDRALVEIIDGCLAVDPRERFPHVQSVLEALRDRANIRARRPLQILGIVGPLLLLLTMGVFGFRAYERAISRSKVATIHTSQRASQFAARGESRSVVKDLENLHNTIKEVAQDHQLERLLRDFLANEDVAGRLNILGDPKADQALMNGAREDFLNAEQRVPLLEFINDLRNRPLPRVASWFLSDARGTTLVSDLQLLPKDLPDGRNYAYRSYFHGGIRDDPSTRHPPLEGPALSAPFRSTATGTYKLAISAPVRRAEETLGVLVMTFELGDFVQFDSSSDEYAMLIDGRSNDHKGLILQHPFYNSQIETDQEGKLRFNIDEERFRVADGIVTQLQAHEIQVMEDPLHSQEGAGQYAGRWIVWAEPVEPTFMKTNGPLLLAVAHRYSSAVKPVSQLGNTLFREGITGLLVVLAGSFAQWYFVWRLLSDAAHSGAVDLAEGDTSQSVHSRETLEMPV